MPRFHVHDTFSINVGATFVLAGFVLEGELTAGMTISIPFHGSANFSAQINRIEFVRRPDGDVVCLCIDCSRPDEMTLWEALKIKNRNIDISMA